MNPDRLHALVQMVNSKTFVTEGVHGAKATIVASEDDGYARAAAAIRDAMAVMPYGYWYFQPIVPINGQFWERSMLRTRLDLSKREEMAQRKRLFADKMDVVYGLFLHEFDGHTAAERDAFCADSMWVSAVPPIKPDDEPAVKRFLPLAVSVYLARIEQAPSLDWDRNYGRWMMQHA